MTRNENHVETVSTRSHLVIASSSSSSSSSSSAVSSTSSSFSASTCFIWCFFFSLFVAYLFWRQSLLIFHQVSFAPLFQPFPFPPFSFILSFHHIPPPFLPSFLPFFLSFFFQSVFPFFCFCFCQLRSTPLRLLIRYLLIDLFIPVLLPSISSLPSCSTRWTFHPAMLHTSASSSASSPTPPPSPPTPKSLNRPSTRLDQLQTTVKTSAWLKYGTNYQPIVINSCSNHIRAPSPLPSGDGYWNQHQPTRRINIKANKLN